MDGFDGAARDEGVPDPRQRLSTEPDHLPARLWWLLGALTLAWGFNWTAMKLALAEVPPWIFRSLCLGLGSCVLFLVLRLGGQRIPLPRGQWLRLIVLALLNITGWNMLVALGLTMIPSGRASILAYTMPVLAIPLSVWLLGERLTAAKALGLLLGLAGLALLIGEGYTAIGAAPLGTLLVLGAAGSWALGANLWNSFPRVPFTDILDIMRDTGFIGIRLTQFPQILKTYDITSAQMRAECDKRGCHVITGVELFVRQAAKQFELFTGKPAPLELMQKLIRRILSPVAIRE